MDAKQQLRRYLEQRRELGESEFVLDGVTVDEALRALGATGASGGPADWRSTLAKAEVAPSEDVREAEYQSLEEVAAAIRACTRCGLYKTATNAVPGDGNPHAEFVCVGEAPGAEEDRTGKPFVGPAGELLTKILAAIDLTREDVFICNVLKHRPPGNRNPSPDEVAACKPFLIRQIELIKPKVILALGTFAAQTLLETKLPIGKLRGQVHRYHGVPLIVTYHPAALLRNASWKRPTWEDVKLARRILDDARARG
ncbi:MAG TPA: uracil-DNA glycosylase [Gemmatimonadaceae bacterium]|nr:uracil-DNA glycosylase [Gemmatimonadaceae bacterium]